MTEPDQPTVRAPRLLPADDLWRWTDRLSLPVKHRLVRESGVTEHLTLPALLDQLEDDLWNPGNSGSTRTRPGSRPPTNLAALSLLGEMEVVLLDAITGEELERRSNTLADKLRQVTAHLVSTAAPDVIDWWARLTKGWAGEVQTLLPGEDDGPMTRPLRGFACPDCETWTIERVTDGETFRDSAVVLVFHDGHVRHALCKACGASWFRGDALAGLTTALADYGLKRIA